MQLNHKLVNTPAKPPFRTIVKNSIKKRVEGIFSNKEAPGIVKHKQLSNINSSYLLMAVTMYTDESKAVEGLMGDVIKAKASTIIDIIIEKAKNNEDEKERLIKTLEANLAAGNEAEIEVAQQVLNKLS